MNALIERACRGEATAAEHAELASWRASNAENERHYHDVVRMLEATTSLRHELTATTPPPTLAARLVRGAADKVIAAEDVRAARDADAAGEVGPVRPLRPGRSLDPSPAPRWRRHVPWLAAAAAVVLLVVNVFHPLIGGVEAPGHHADVVTGPGEITTVQLADGSVVRVAPSSRLRLGEGGDPRLVALDGRAFFSIAQAAGRPFRVRTAAGTATVLGTRFEIRTGADELQLVVIEGRVALEAPGNTVIVAAGEHSAVSNRVAAAPAAIGDADDVLRWTGRFLAFQGTPLRDAAREIEAMYGVRITITDSALGDRTVTAVFTGHDLHAVLSVMCEIVDARCVADSDEVTVLPR